MYEGLQLFICSLINVQICVINGCQVLYNARFTVQRFALMVIKMFLLT